MFPGSGVTYVPDRTGRLRLRFEIYGPGFGDEDDEIAVPDGL
jgi:hypothetical protein